MTRTAEAITEALMEPFPEDILEDKNNMTYVPAEHVRMRLMEATDNCYDWRIVSTEYRIDGAAQTKGEAIPVCICVGELHIPGLNSTRAGVGVQEIQERQGADAAYKGASSDALKRAAMEFGVGLQQLYIDTGKAKRPAPRQQQRSAPTHQTGKKSDSPTAEQLSELKRLATTLNISDEDKIKAIRSFVTFDSNAADALIRDWTDQASKLPTNTQEAMDIIEQRAAPDDPWSDVEVAAEKQTLIGRIMGHAAAMGWDNDTVKDKMHAKYRKATPRDEFSRKDLTLDELTEFTDWIKGETRKGIKPR